MPVLPANILGQPDAKTQRVPFLTQTLAADLTTELAVVSRTGYLTKATIIPVGAAASDATNTRKWELTDASSKAPTDGCIVDPANGLGAWNVATAYTTGKWVVLNNLPYVCISNVTGGTGPGVDTSHWQAIAVVGLGWVNFFAVALTQDDVGRTMSDSGNTNIPASSFVGAVVAANGATAAAIVSAAPALGGGPTNSPTAQPLQPTAGVVANGVNGTAVIARTVTFSGTARVLAVFSALTVSLVAGTPISLVLGTDTRVFAGDVLKLVSTHLGTGVADPGGTCEFAVTAIGEGSD